MTPVTVPVAWATLELALQGIEQFARDNHMRGEELIAVLEAGIAAHRGFLIEAEDRRPHHVLESLVVRSGPVVVAFKESPSSGVRFTDVSTGIVHTIGGA